MNAAFFVCFIACIILGCMIRPAINHDRNMEADQCDGLKGTP